MSEKPVKPCNGNGNKFRLTTLHNNSGKQVTSPAHRKVKHISSGRKYRGRDKYKGSCFERDGVGKLIFVGLCAVKNVFGSVSGLRSRFSRRV